MTEESRPQSKSRSKRWRRIAWRVVVALAAVGMITVLVLYASGRSALGDAPEGERLERMVASPNWSDGRFRNRLPQTEPFVGALREVLRSSDDATPEEAVAFVRVEPARFAAPPEGGLRVTWLGHSIMLLELDGVVVLTDPVWGPRASPWTWLGPTRWYEPLIDLEDLPPIDAVVISHDHYDHLDYSTFETIKDWPTTFIAPLGVGAHLEAWGVPSERIIELDWWERYELGAVEIVSTPARHASGRQLLDRDRTLWAGYAFRGPAHSAFFSGDTGMFPEIDEIGSQLGPFDLTMIEVGAYAQAWPDWHMGPEQALDAHERVGGTVFLPVHWGLFNLSTHGWTEPIERVLVGAATRNIQALALRPGESYELGVPVEIERWWPDRPWRDASEYPIEATGLPRSVPP